MASSPRIEELRKKFDENPRRYFAPLANEYRKAGDLDQAIFICQEYLPQQPGHMSGHIVYGQALFEAHRHDEARTVFETALTLDPENLIALRHLGDIAAATGDPGSARSWYQRVLDADPRNEEIASLLTAMAGSPSKSAPTATSSPEMAATESSPPLVEPPAPESSNLVTRATVDPATTSVAAPLELEKSIDIADQLTAADFGPLAGLQSNDPTVDGPDGGVAESSLAELEINTASHESSAAQQAPSAVAPPPSLPPPPAPPAPPTPPAPPASPEPPASAAPGPAFVTETMAELYLQQGHVDEAVAVYEKLVALRPDDLAIRARLSSATALASSGPAHHEATAPAEPVLTIREFLARIAARTVTPMDAPTIATGERPTSEEPSAEPERPSDPQRVDSVSAGQPGSIDAVFEGAIPAEEDERAAARLAEAFTVVGVDEPPPIVGEPARRASDELSLDHVFKGRAGSGNQGAFSFDQFFSEKAADAAGGSPSSEQPPPGAEASPSGDDIQQFNDWLEGLKKT